MRVQATRVLPFSPERVWAFAARWEEQPRWIRDAVWVRMVSERREGVGARIRVMNRVLGIPLFAEELEVTSWDPPRRLEMGHRSFVRGTGTWAFEAEGSATRLTWTEELHLPVPLLGELALWVYRPFMRRLMARGLADLQALLAST